MAKRLFIFQLKGDAEFMKKHVPVGCSNLRILHERSGMGYDNLVRIFTRKCLRYYESESVVIMKVYESMIIRGKQGLSKRGVGGKKFSGSGYNRDY
jgi:hypothetical protein